MRRVDITRTTNVADVDGLAQHPNIRRFWSIPGGYTLFEFYDPIFEELDNPTSALSDPTKWPTDVRLRMSGLVDEERAILAPLYAGRPRHWQGNVLFLPLKTVLYRVLDKKKIPWPWFGCSADWEIERRIKVVGRLRNSNPQSQNALADCIARWAVWASDLGELSARKDLTFAGDNFEVLCEFSAPCGDACLALYIMLTLSREPLRLEATGFQVPNQESIVYMRFGAPGVMRSDGQLTSGE